MRILPALHQRVVSPPEIFASPPPSIVSLRLSSLSHAVSPDPFVLVLIALLCAIGIIENKTDERVTAVVATLLPTKNMFRGVSMLVNVLDTRTLVLLSFYLAPLVSFLISLL